MKNNPTLPHFVCSLPPEGALFILGQPGNEKSPTSFDIGLQAEIPYCLRLAGCWKRPGSLRVQSCLSRRGSRYSRCFGSFGSRFFRGFLRSGLFRCFLGGRLFRSGFLGRWFLRYLFRGLLGCWLFSCGFLRRWLLGRYLLGCWLFRWRFFRSWLLGRYFFRWSFFSRSFFRCCFFRRSLLSRYFFSRGFLWSSFFSRSFFRSCHSFLLDHVAKSTSRLEYVKRFTALGPG